MHTLIVAKHERRLHVVAEDRLLVHSEHLLQEGEDADFAPQRVLRMDHSLCLSPCFVEATTTLHVGTGSLLFICPRSAAMPPPSSATEGIQEAITGDPISRSPPARTESKHEIFRKFARPESRPSQPKFRRYFLKNRLRPNVTKKFSKS